MSERYPRPTREESYARMDKRTLQQIVRQLKDDEEMKMFCVPPYQAHTWAIDYLLEKHNYIYDGKYFKQEYSNQ